MRERKEKERERHTHTNTQKEREYRKEQRRKIDREIVCERCVRRMRAREARKRRGLYEEHLQ